MKSQVQMYLNGNYWGIHNLREKTNEHFIASHYGIDVDDIDFVENKDDFKSILNKIDSKIKKIA